MGLENVSLRELTWELRAKKTLHIPEPAKNHNEFYREAIATFPIIVDSLEFSFLVPDLPLPRAEPDDGSHALSKEAVSDYIANCHANGIIPFSVAKFEMHPYWFSDKERQFPLIFNKSGDSIIDGYHVNSEGLAQIADAVIQREVAYELHFNLCAGIQRDTLGAFRSQCLESAFRNRRWGLPNKNAYSFNRGRFNKMSEHNGEIANLICLLGRFAAEGGGITTLIKEDTAPANEQLLENWVNGIAERYRCSVVSE